MDAIKEEFTIKDVYALPEGERAELMDGRIYYMEPPGTKHQRLVGRLFNDICNYIESHHGVCEPFVAPFGVFLFADEHTYVEPDISVICNPDKIKENGCYGAPDWVIEIVSPSSRYMDYLKKLLKYESAGVREYWIVDPDRQQVMVYNFEKETNEAYPFGQPVPVGIYEGFTIEVS